MNPVTIDQIETPALLIDLDKLEKNIRLLSDFFKNAPWKLAPHFKTHKCPMIARMQLAAGASAITCAKLSEAEVLCEAGVPEIVIANQIVDTAKVYRLAALAGRTKLAVCVDNAQNIAELSQAALVYDSTVHVLVEVEAGMHRCGVETKEEALALVRQITASKNLKFYGLQVYAGQLSHEPDESVRSRGIQDVRAKAIEVKEYLEQNGLAVCNICGDGTGTFSLLGSDSIWTQIQAGSYVFMDTVYDKLNLGFENALTVLTTVIHKRPGLAVTDAGLKVCGVDQGLPTVKDHESLGIVLNEEHGKIADTGDELRYLQKLEYIPAHCCSTVNLHDEFYCVRGGLLAAVWPISGRGKSR